jgi:pimeloyl-ACP methyl ester carboxylesterase
MRNRRSLTRRAWLAIGLLLALRPLEGSAQQRIQVRQGPLPRPEPETWDNSEKAFLAGEEGQALAAALDRYFQEDPERRTNFAFAAGMDAQVEARPALVRKMAWAAYRRGWAKKHCESDLAHFKVTWKNFTMRYLVHEVGQRPRNGWPLFIALHGGGGAPREVNDGQWLTMTRYYKDHPELGGYLYCAPRAPTDGWNGFYTDYNIPLWEQLLRQLMIATDIDPNKVFLMGYSHGGYGTFYGGMKLADRFAGCHASAADPPGNWRDFMNLRNIYFSALVGGLDTRHGRLDGITGFRKGRLEAQAKFPGSFRGPTDIVTNTTHSMLQDRDMITNLYSEVRDPLPCRITWAPDRRVRSFYWLNSPDPIEGEVDATCSNNVITIATKGLANLVVYLDERLVNISKTVTITADGRSTAGVPRPSLLTLCETLAERGDREYMFTVRVPLKVGPPPKPTGTPQ